jgi:hypothetical protein
MFTSIKYRGARRLIEGGVEICEREIRGTSVFMYASKYLVSGARTGRGSMLNVPRRMCVLYFFTPRKYVNLEIYNRKIRTTCVLANRMRQPVNNICTDNVL